MNIWAKVVDIFSRFNHILLPKQKKKCLRILIIILFGAVFETIGVSAIVPFVQVMMSPETLMKNSLVQKVMGILSIDSATGFTFLLGMGIVIIYIIKNIFLAFSSWCQIKFQNVFQKELSSRMFFSYMKMPYTYFLNTNSSEILTNVQSDVIGLYLILSAIFKVIVEGITALFICIFVLVTDAVMAISIILLTGACLLTVTGGFKRVLKKIGEERRLYDALRHKHLYQGVNGIKEIMVMDRKVYFAAHYEKAFDKYQKVETVNTFLSTVPERIIEAVCISGLLMVVCIRVLSGVPAASFIPQLAAFAVAAFRILPAMSRIVSGFNQMIVYKPMLDAVDVNLKEIESYEAYLEKYEQENRATDQNIDIQKEFESEVVLQGITWKYPNAEEYVLNELNLTIKKGKSIAFIGSSGSGKTTLADVILGLLRPEAGTIEMDGTDIFLMRKQWCRIIGYVPQAVFLTDDTIRNNVAFGIEEEDIDDTAIWNALRQAQLEKFVKSLPHGLDTVAGERGIKFSGGQKQRVAIARALYYNPEILVLDEATAALDNETETAVMESIDALQGHITLIIVAHRLTTIRNCDEIYEIVEGKAVLKDKLEILQEV